MAHAAITEHTLTQVAKNSSIPKRKADWANIWNPSTKLWEERYCILKRTLLFVFHDDKLSKLVFAFALEGSKVRGILGDDAISGQIVAMLPTQTAKSDDIYILDLRQQDVNIQMEVGSVRKGVIWKQLFLEAAGANDVNKGDATAGRVGMENLSLSNKVLELSTNLGESRETIERLQIAAEASSKAASEVVEQKMTALSTSQRRIEILLSEAEGLRGELREWQDKFAKQYHNYTTAIAEKATIRERFREMLLDWEEQEDDSKRAAVKMTNLRQQSQQLVLDNRSLRNEIKGYIESFHGRQRDFREKVQLLKELMEATDVFDLLRKRLELAEHKIKYLEDGYRISNVEENALRCKILQLQQEVHMAEAVARSYYLKHRGYVLQDQLRVIGDGIPHSEYYTFAKTIIERHGWLFREMEMVDRERQVPWWDEVLRAESAIPFRAQLYPPSAVEGGESWAVALGASLMRPPEKRVPASQNE